MRGNCTEFKKNRFFLLKMYFRYLKIKCKRFGNLRYIYIFFFQSYSLLRWTPQRAGRQILNFWTRFFFKTVFFNSASSRTRTIFIRSIWNFNGICKTKLSTQARGIFWYVENWTSHQAFFKTFLRETRIYFQTAVIFSKINVFKNGSVFPSLFLYRK